MSTKPTQTDGGSNTTTNEHAASAVLDVIQMLNNAQANDEPETADVYEQAREKLLEAADADADAEGLFEERIRSVALTLADVETAAPDEYTVIAAKALAELAPLAATVARNRHAGTGRQVTVDEDVEADTVDLDIDLEAANDPVAALNSAIIEANQPAWTVETVVSLDAETAKRYQPAFEQALDESEDEFINLVLNMGRPQVSVNIEGYPPEYFFAKKPARFFADEGEELLRDRDEDEE